MTHYYINNKIDKVFLVDKPDKHEKGSFNKHKTVKPLSLFKYLIKLTSKKNSVILDPFIGSGTTALAYKELERNFIGVEINKEYIDIAVERLKTKEEKQMQFSPFETSS